MSSSIQIAGVRELNIIHATLSPQATTEKHITHHEVYRVSSSFVCCPVATIRDQSSTFSNINKLSVRENAENQEATEDDIK